MEKADLPGAVLDAGGVNFGVAAYWALKVERERSGVAGIEALRESGVEVGAFWWADMPEVSEAERFIRQSGGSNSEN